MFAVAENKRPDYPFKLKRVATIFFLLFFLNALLSSFLKVTFCARWLPKVRSSSRLFIDVLVASVTGRKMQKSVATHLRNPRDKSDWEGGAELTNPISADEARQPLFIRFLNHQPCHCGGGREIHNRVVTLSGNSKATRTIFLPGLDAEQPGVIHFPIRKKTTCFRSPENSIFSLFSPPVKWIRINVGPWRHCLMHFLV